MNTKGPYKALLLDGEGFWICDQECDTKREAIERCRYWLTDEFARTGAESTHEGLGTRKAEVRNAKGECVWDAFRENKTELEETK